MKSGKVLDSYTIVDGEDIPSVEVYDEDAKETTITFTLPASVVVGTVIDVYYEHEYVGAFRWATRRY